MSTADDACREWIAERTGIAQSQRGIAISQAAFMAGYRRALEDAADALDHEGNLYMEEILRTADGLNLTGSFTVQSARQLIEQSRTEPAEWLRDRAAEVGTKDGDDDE